MEYPNELVKKWEESSWEDRESLFSWICGRYLDYAKARIEEWFIMRTINREWKCKCGHKEEE